MIEKTFNDILKAVQDKTGQVALDVRKDVGFLPLPEFLGVVFRGFSGMAGIGSNDPVYREFCDMLGIDYGVSIPVLAEKLNEYYGVPTVRLAALVSGSVTDWDEGNLLIDEMQWSPADVDLWYSRFMGLSQNLDQQIVQNSEVLMQIIPSDLFNKSRTNMLRKLRQEGMGGEGILNAIGEQLEKLVGDPEDLKRLRDMVMEKASEDLEDSPDEDWDDVLFLKGKDDDNVH